MKGLLITLFLISSSLCAQNYSYYYMGDEGLGIETNTANGNETITGFIEVEEQNTNTLKYPITIHRLSSTSKQTMFNIEDSKLTATLSEDSRSLNVKNSEGKENITFDLTNKSFATPKTIVYRVAIEKMQLCGFAGREKWVIKYPAIYYDKDIFEEDDLEYFIGFETEGNNPAITLFDLVTDVSLSSVGESETELSTMSVNGLSFTYFIKKVSNILTVTMETSAKLVPLSKSKIEKTEVLK